MGMYEHWPYTNFHELNLDWIIKEMKLIETEMEDIRSWKEDWEDTLSDLNDKYAEIVHKYDVLEKEFNDLISQVHADFDSLTQNIIQRFGLLQFNLEADLQAFKNEIQFQVTGLSNQVNALDRKVDQALDNLSESLTMINPFTGTEDPISQIIMQLASFHMQDALTAQEYDNLHLTAQDYDNRSLTAYQYDIQGKQYLL